MMLWRLMWPWLRAHRKLLIAALALALVTVLAGVGLLTVAGWFLTGAYLAGAGAVFNLFAPSALIRGLAFWRIGARWGERVAGHAATLRLLADMRTTVFARMVSLSPVQLAAYQEGDLVARLAGDIDALDTFFLLVLAPLLTALAGGLLFSLLVGVYVPMMGWAVFAVLLVAIGVVPFLLTWRAKRPGGHAQLAAAQTRVLVHDMVAAHVDITAYAVQPQLASRFDSAARGLSASRDRLAGVGAAGQFMQQLMVSACVLVLLGMGLLAHQQGQLSGPVWAGLLLGGIGLFEVLGPLMRGATRLGLTMAAAKRLREIMATKPAMTDIQDPLEVPAHGDIVLQAVDFSWSTDGHGTQVLKDVNLSIPQGQRLAITGASGAGKSTLLALMMRMVDPSAGQVLYAGLPLMHMRSASLHQRFTLLSQHSPVFLGTVRDNLLMGNPQALDAELWQVLAQAGIYDFVQSLDQGLDTWVGEAGRSLSVGQVRRLCLARALLTPATVWMLDEPTAGLDTQAQTAFFNDLGRVAAGRTVIIATHAVLPAGTVDRVLKVADGVVSDTVA
ncbi:MAG: thiol reductant ABC exporter subunit CydC [Burkholderiaceae bacterium]|nr:thiol reductant ABC exporter subunit CydC [Burkholderiaceae bacterium]